MWLYYYTLKRWYLFTFTLILGWLGDLFWLVKGIGSKAAQLPRQSLKRSTVFTFIFYPAKTQHQLTTMWVKLFWIFQLFLGPTNNSEIEELCMHQPTELWEIINCCSEPLNCEVFCFIVIDNCNNKSPHSLSINLCSSLCCPLLPHLFSSAINF